MDTIKLSVDGMSCGGCTGKIETLLNEKDGVNNVNADLDSKSVTVTFDSAAIQEPAIRTVIEDVGFDVVS